MVGVKSFYTHLMWFPIVMKGRFFSMQKQGIVLGMLMLEKSDSRNWVVKLFALVSDIFIGEGFQNVQKRGCIRIEESCMNLTIMVETKHHLPMPCNNLFYM